MNTYKKRNLNQISDTLSRADGDKIYRNLHGPRPKNGSEKNLGKNEYLYFSSLLVRDGNIPSPMHAKTRLTEQTKQ